MTEKRVAEGAGGDERRWGWPWLPRSDRDRARATRTTFVFHLRPIRLPASTLHWSHTMGLGGSAATLVLLLAVTGILMVLVYSPTPGSAYQSVTGIEQRVAFGSLVRGVHYWSANLLIGIMLLHTARVLLTGGFLRPRRLNWEIGLGLLAVVLAAAFTGYLLPWDQLSYWAITITTGMLSYLPVVGEALQRVVRGGAEIGSDTLLTFYTFHTTLLPTALLALMALHFWRVRRAKGVVRPVEVAAGDDEMVLFLPHLLVRELAQALIVIAVVVVLAAMVGAPLGEAANPGMSPNPVKAPWYFVGFQELLIHLHPLFAVMVLPLAAGIGLLGLPLLARGDAPVGSWFRSFAGRRSAASAAVAAALVTPLLVLGSDRWSQQPGWLLGGLLPVVLLAALVAAFVAFVRRRFGAGHDETLQAVAVLVFIAFAVLTVIGVWFRGPGMALTWPWAQ